MECLQDGRQKQNVTRRSESAFHRSLFGDSLTKESAGVILAASRKPKAGVGKISKVGQLWDIR
jgi:hypothetical protein